MGCPTVRFNLNHQITGAAMTIQICTVPAPFTSELHHIAQRLIAIALHRHALYTWANITGGYKGLVEFHRQTTDFGQARYCASREWRSIKKFGVPEKAVWLKDGMVYGVFSGNGESAPFAPLFNADESLEAAVIATAIKNGKL